MLRLQTTRRCLLLQMSIDCNSQPPIVLCCVEKELKKKQSHDQVYVYRARVSVCVWVSCESECERKCVWVSCESVWMWMCVRECVCAYVGVSVVRVSVCMYVCGCECCVCECVVLVLVLKLVWVKDKWMNEKENRKGPSRTPTPMADRAARTSSTLSVGTYTYSPTTTFIESVQE